MVIGPAAKELHQEALALKKYPKEFLPTALNEMGKKIEGMLKSQDFEPFKVGLSDVKKRISSVSKRLEKDQNAKIELDCHGIGVKIKSVFKQFITSKANNPPLPQNANAEIVEKFTLAHNIDINEKNFLTVALNRSCEAVKPDMGLLETLYRAGAEFNTVNGDRAPLNIVLGHYNPNNKEALTKFLTENGANPSHREGEFVRKHHPLPIWMAKFKETSIPNNVMNPLIDAHMDVNMAAASTTPLNENLKYGNKSRAQVLVAGDAKPEWTVEVDAATEDLLKKTADVRDDIFSTYPCERHVLVDNLRMMHAPKEVLSIVYDFIELKPSEICQMVLDATANAK